MKTQTMIGNWVSKEPWRIYILFILLLLLPIAIFAYSVGRVLRHQAEAQAVSESAQIVHVAAALVQEDFREDTEILQSIATRPSLRQAWAEDNLAMVERTLADAEVQNPDFTFVSAFALDGTLRAVYPVQPGTLNRNFAYRDWYKGTSRQWTPYVSEVYQNSIPPSTGSCDCGPANRRCGKAGSYSLPDSECLLSATMRFPSAAASKPKRKISPIGQRAGLPIFPPPSGAAMTDHRLDLTRTAELNARMSFGSAFCPSLHPTTSARTCSPDRSNAYVQTGGPSGPGHCSLSSCNN